MDRRDLLPWQSSVLVPGPHGGLMEELGEPEKEMTRKAKGREGNCGAKS
jgi:hypothetical protein